MASVLTEVSTGDNTSLYNLADSNKLKVFMASTPETREVCTKPEIIGQKLEEDMKKGIAKVIALLTPLINKEIGARYFVDHLNIHRGGDNFDVRYGLRNIGYEPIRHHVYSQRKKIKTKNKKTKKTSEKWITVQDFTKLFSEGNTPPRDIDFFSGDIVATGVSLETALSGTLDRMKDNGHRLNSFYFFTIGGQRTEEVLEKVVKEYGAVLTDNFKMRIIYLEGRFGIASEETPLAIKTVDTDLLSYHEGAIITPEFAKSLLDSPTNLLEVCVIYDGGKRLNTWPAHYHEVIEYWDQLRARAEKGLTLYEAFRERNPLIDVETVDRLKELYPSWINLDDQKIIPVLQSRKGLLSLEDSSLSLTTICEKRTNHLKKIYHG